MVRQRNLFASTSYGPLEQATQVGEPVDLTKRWTFEQGSEMTKACMKTGLENLTDAQKLPSDLYGYGQLRLSRAVHGQK